MWTALYIVCLCLLGISTAICITYCIFYAKDKVQTKRTAVILNIIAYIVPFLNFVFSIILLFLNPSDLTTLGWITIIATPCLCGIEVIISAIFMSYKKNKQIREQEELERKVQAKKLTINDVPQEIIDKVKAITYKNKIDSLFQRDKLSEAKYNLMNDLINQGKFINIELPEEELKEVLEDVDIVALETYKKLYENKQTKDRPGKLNRKNGIIIAICLIIGVICIFSAILAGTVGIDGEPDNVSAGICGAIAFVSIFIGISGWTNRRKICPNCGECWGKKIDSSYIGSSQKTVQKHITKAEYDRKVKGNDSWVETDGKGNYFERTIETTSNYVNTLKCPNCGHTWKINESQKD